MQAADTQWRQEDERPLLRVAGLSFSYGSRVAFRAVSFELFDGEIMAIVGESGSGKTSLLDCLGGRLVPATGSVEYRLADSNTRRILELDEAERRALMRSEWGFVHQSPTMGLRMNVSAGANVGERLMATGSRNYGRIRESVADWLDQVEIGRDRINDAPKSFSGGMLQRLQIARNLITHPRLVLMDEPTGGLDVSVQARLLDLIRSLASGLGLAAILVTHDLAVARLLADRILVMHRGEIVEAGLVDRVLDDPRHPYAQLLVASVLRI